MYKAQPREGGKRKKSCREKDGGVSLDLTENRRFLLLVPPLSISDPDVGGTGGFTAPPALAGCR